MSGDGLVLNAAIIYHPGGCLAGLQRRIPIRVEAGNLIVGDDKNESGADSDNAHESRLRGNEKRHVGGQKAQDMVLRPVVVDTAKIKGIFDSGRVDLSTGNLITELALNDSHINPPPAVESSLRGYGKDDSVSRNDRDVSHDIHVSGFQDSLRGHDDDGYISEDSLDDPPIASDCTPATETSDEYLQHWAHKLEVPTDPSWMLVRTDRTSHIEIDADILSNIPLMEADNSCFTSPPDKLACKLGFSLSGPDTETDDHDAFLGSIVPVIQRDAQAPGRVNAFVAISCVYSCKPSLTEDGYKIHEPLEISITTYDTWDALHGQARVGCQPPRAALEDDLLGDRGSNLFEYIRSYHFVISPRQSHRSHVCDMPIPGHSSAQQNKGYAYAYGQSHVVDMATAASTINDIVARLQQRSSKPGGRDVWLLNDDPHNLMRAAKLIGLDFLGAKEHLTYYLFHGHPTIQMLIARRPALTFRGMCQMIGIDCMDPYWGDLTRNVGNKAVFMIMAWLMMETMTPQQRADLVDGLDLPIIPASPLREDFLDNFNNADGSPSATRKSMRMKARMTRMPPKHVVKPRQLKQDGVFTFW